MSIRQFKVLTFDVVGTLIDFESGILDAFRSIGGKAADGLSDDDLFAPYLEARVEHPGRSSQVFANVYLYVARKLGLPDDVGSADAFQLAVLRWPAFEDSAEALSRLRRYFRLVAMTNADRVAFSAYSHTLGHPFHDAVTMDDAKCAKPDSNFFSFNLGRQSAFGYRQEDILHVAQSQYHDIGIARSLGYNVCWIERRMHQEGYGGTPRPDKVTKPDYHFATLRQLADAVEKEFGGSA